MFLTNLLQLLLHLQTHYRHNTDTIQNFYQFAATFITSTDTLQTQYRHNTKFLTVYINFYYNYRHITVTIQTQCNVFNNFTTTFITTKATLETQYQHSATFLTTLQLLLLHLQTHYRHNTDTMQCF